MFTSKEEMHYLLSAFPKNQCNLYSALCLLQKSFIYQIINFYWTIIWDALNNE